MGASGMLGTGHRRLPRGLFAAGEFNCPRGEGGGRRLASPALLPTPPPLMRLITRLLASRKEIPALLAHEEEGAVWKLRRPESSPRRKRSK